MALECRVALTSANQIPLESRIHRKSEAVEEVKPQVTKANVRFVPNVTVTFYLACYWPF